MPLGPRFQSFKRREVGFAAHGSTAAAYSKTEPTTPMIVPNKPVLRISGVMLARSRRYRPARGVGVGLNP